MKTYRTSEIADLIGIHPNTVRFYEEWGLIPKAKRQPNGYRIFTDFHIEQLRLARIAFRIEIVQNGLRKKIIEAVKHSADRDFDKALLLAEEYLLQILKEQEHAEEDIKRLKIIRSLRCANYSLEAILRMLNALSVNPQINIKHVLNTPRNDTDVISGRVDKGAFTPNLSRNRT